MSNVNPDLVLLLIIFLMLVLALILIDDDTSKKQEAEVIKEALKEQRTDIDSSVYELVIDNQKKEIKRLEKKILN